MKIEPSVKRRYVKREYNHAVSLIRKIFDIPDDEYIFDLIFDSPNSKIIIKTLKDCNKKKGDI